MKTNVVVKKALEIKNDFLVNSTIHPSWVSINELKEVFSRLRIKINTNPHYHKNIKKHSLWNDYLNVSSLEYSSFKYPITFPVNILEDIFSLEHFLDEAKRLGHKYVILYIM